jgi:hypothetical protein
LGTGIMTGISRIAAVRALSGIVVAMLVAGCSSMGSWFGSGASPPPPASKGSDSLSDRLGNFFAGPAPKVMATGTGNDPAEPGFECPSVGIREGASTLSVNTPNVDATPMNLRYQVTIARTARECAKLGAMLTMKVGVQGRVILGPNGGPGSLDVPIRYALVHEGVDAKTLVSKLDRIKVEIPPNQTNVSFTHVEEDMSIPMPSASDIDDLVLYVGFDPTGAADEEKQRHKPQAKPRPKAKAKTAAQNDQ